MKEEYIDVDFLYSTLSLETPFKFKDSFYELKKSEESFSCPFCYFYRDICYISVRNCKRYNYLYLSKNKLFDMLGLIK